MRHRDALIVFARNPIAGEAKTRLAEHVGNDVAADVYTAFLLDSLDRYDQTDSDVRLYFAPSSEPLVPALSHLEDHVIPQSGHDLGLRMSRAFDETFSIGYERVVIVGTDHPTLPLSMIESAFEALTTIDSVTIGPSEDGGYYLLGLTASHPELFTEMTYSHSSVFADTLDRIEGAGLSPHVLSHWYDIDRIEDLRRLVSDLMSDPGKCPRTMEVLTAAGLIENTSKTGGSASRKAYF